MTLTSLPDTPPLPATASTALDSLRGKRVFVLKGASNPSPLPAGLYVDASPATSELAAHRVVSLGATSPVNANAWPDEGTWEVLVVAGAGPDLDPLALFPIAHRLLAPEGEILLIDRFVLNCTGSESAAAWRLPQFLALAEREGYTLGRESQARIPDTPDENLAVSLDLRLERKRLPPWRTSSISAENADQMRQLFAEVFGHTMSERHWQWKYGDHRGAGVGVWRAENGRLVAHYGGISREIQMFGKPARAFQAGDVMVTPEERGTLSRRGPVFLATAACLEQQIGFGAPNLLGVGFPNERAYRLPARLGLYSRPLGRIVELRWPSLKARAALGWEIRQLDPHLQSARQQLDSCWQSMADGLRDHVLGVRNGAYLQWRYGDHPEHTYRVFIVRQRLFKTPLGAFVVRQMNDGCCELLDVIAAPENVPRIVRQARRIAHALKCHTLIAWAIDNIVSTFGSEAAVHDLHILVPGNAWTPGPDNETVVGRWWLTGGDTDFR